MKTNCPVSRTRIDLRAYPRLKPLLLAIFSMTQWNASPVLAADGSQIIQGKGSVQTNQQTTTINQQSNALILNWNNFNIAPNERVQFLQPSSSSIALNRVLSSDPTSIFGQLLANGQIFLINPNGITFGANAQINVGSLVASTLDISDADFLSGAASGKFIFSGAGNGRIVNQGTINAANGGHVALIAKQVSNQGTLNAPQGTVALAAGERVTLSHISGLLNVSVEAATLDALVENKQAIRADGGQVILSAKAADALLNTVVNQTGIIEARSIENKNGRIFLSGGPSGVVNVAGTLDASGKNPGERGGEMTVTGQNISLNKDTSIDASGAAAGGTVLVGGDYQGGGDSPRANALWMDATAGIAANATLDGPGGKVVLWSDEATRAYGSISATGSQAGGLVETSGHYLDVAGIRVDASSANGLAGLWLLDPNNLSIQTTGSNTNVSAGPNFTTTKDSAILTTATIQTALNAGGGTSVVISTASAAPNTQAGNITFATNSKIAYTGTKAGVGLTLNADNNIVANSGTAITATNGALNVTLNAGKQASGNGIINLGTTTITSNGGKITLSGAPNGGGASGDRGILLNKSTLTAAGGDIVLTATGGTTGATTNRGIELTGSTLSTTGAGTISLTGTGGSKANNYGVLLTATSKLQSATGTVNVTGKAGNASTGTGIGVLVDTTSNITSTSGKITLTGTGSSSATGGANHGVQINSTTGISSTFGDIQLTGNSGAGTTNDVGVRIIGAAPISTGGNITISGKSNGNGTTTNYGVEINNGKLTTSGTGNITVNGTGGGKTNNYGAYVTASSALQTANGSATLTGNAGSASSGTGIGLLLDNKASIVTGTGNVSISGTGSSGATGTANNGVQINSTGGVISTSGNIQITGTSGTGTGADVGVRILGASPITTAGSAMNVTGKSVSTGAANGNVGVDISAASTLTNSNAAGLIDINGTGGGGAGTNRFGVNIAGSTVRATAGGAINITGAGGGKFAGINIAATNPVIGNAATKNITLTASNGGGGDALALAAGSKLLGAGTLTLQGPIAATTVGVGGAASSTFNVQMDTTELGFIQPGFANIVFGRSDGAGAITVGAGSTNANTTIQGSKSNITINGAFATIGSKLTLATGGTVTESGAGTLTVNAGAGTLQLQNGGTFNLTNNNNAGTLNASGTSLNYRDDTGFIVSGISTSGNITLSTAGNVTQTGAITAGPGGMLNLNGAGGVYNLCTQNNDIATLNANTKTVAFRDVNSYALGTLTLTGALELAGNFGSSGNITATSFLFDAPSQNVTFTNSGTITTLAANVAGLNYSQANSLIIGKVTNTFCSPGTTNGITSSGNVAIKTTGANSDISLAANTPITFTGAAPGAISLNAQRNVTLNAGSTIGSSGQAVDVTLNANLQGNAAGGGGVSLTSATIASNNGNITLAGDPSGTGFSSNKAGSGIVLDASKIDAGGGALTLGGEGAGAANSSGVALTNGSIATSSGAINVTGKSISGGDQAIGVLVMGANSKIENTGNGAMNITGTGSSALSATNATGISIANSARVIGKDGSTNLIGVGGTNSAGVRIDNATAGANGLGAFTIKAQGNGTAAGLTASGTQAILLADQGGTLILEASNGGGADALVLGATTKIQGNGNLILLGASATDTMGIGGAASAAHSLQIDQTELATIQPGLANITFGRSDGTGLITIGNGLINAATTIQAASANMDIIGTYTAIGVDLTLTTAGIATESASNHALIVNAGAGTLNLLGGGTYNLCKGDNDAGTLTANATELAFNDINNLTLGTPFTVTNDIALGVNGTLNAPSGINGGGLALFGNNVTFNNLGNVGKLAAAVTGDLIYSQSNSYAIDTVNNACLGGAVNGITAGGNVSLTVGAGNTVTQSATGLISSNNLSLNGGRFSLTQNNSIATLSANAQELALRDDGGFVVNGLSVSGATRLISNGGNVTQTGAISSTGLALTGAGGVFNLSDSGNKITTLAADTGEVRFASSSAFALGSVTTTADGTIAGVKANTVGLTSSGSVTQDASGTITASGLALNGAGGAFNLDQSSNDVQTIAVNSADVRFADSNGFAIGSVTTAADGVTTTGATISNNFGLTSDGLVTQSAALSSTGLALNGANGTFNLGNLGNNVVTFAARAKDIRFAAGNGFDIGSVMTIDGSTTTGLSATGSAGLTASGTVTQSAVITTPSLALNGAGGVFNLSNIGNDVQTLAIDTQAARFSDGDGFAIASVTTLADGTTTNGATVTSDLGLTSIGSVTQTATIIAPALAVNGAGGQFNLDHAGNDVNAFAANAADVYLRDGNGFAISSVNTSADGLTTNGIAATNSVGLDSNGPVTQTAPIIAPQIALTGNGSAFSLGLPGNDVVTLATNTGSLKFSDDNGFNIGTANTLNGAVIGLTTSENAALSAANGVVSQDGSAPIQIGAGTGSLNLTGGTFQLAGINNNVGALTASGIALNFRDDDGFNVDGINITGTACLLSDGNVTQSAAGIIADALGLGGSGSFVLNSANNDINTLAASGQGLVYRDANGFDIGTVTPSGGLPKSGINVIENAVLIANSDVTQSAAIVAAGLSLGGGNANYSLNDSANQITTLAANTNKLNYSQANSLTIGSVTGVDLSATNGVTGADQVTIQTTSPTANLTLHSAVTAQGSGFAVVLSTQNDFINNVGATALLTPNGTWAVYANNPTTSVFNGLTAPTNLFSNSIATLPPSALPGGANVMVFQNAEPPPPPPAPLNPDLYGAGASMLDFNIAETTRADLLNDIVADDFLDAWKKIAYVPLEVVYGGMKLPEGLAIQEVELQKLRRRLGITGDPMHRYFWWR
jgi:trimeric autotransporter adhesin